MLRKRKRMSAPSARMSHGVQSTCASRSSSESAAAGENSVSPRVGSAPLLVSESMRILVTGGCGFIGSNFIRYILQHYSPEYVSNVDALTYAGSLASTADLAAK